MSGSRTNHQLHWFQRYPHVFPRKPCNVLMSIIFRVGVRPIRVGAWTSLKPPCRFEPGGTVIAAVNVIILVWCGELHVIVVIKGIPYNHIIIVYDAWILSIQQDLHCIYEAHFKVWCILFIIPIFDNFCI